jgi:hypothetical protein
MLSLASFELSQTQSNRTLFMHVDLTPTFQRASHSDPRGYMSSGLQQTPPSLRSTRAAEACYVSQPR